jgi:hypothetical protein
VHRNVTEAETPVFSVANSNTRRAEASAMPVASPAAEWKELEAVSAAVPALTRICSRSAMASADELAALHALTAQDQ